MTFLNVTPIHVLPCSAVDAELLAEAKRLIYKAVSRVCSDDEQFQCRGRSRRAARAGGCDRPNHRLLLGRKASFSQD